jgi:hypothetical protein
MVYRDLRRDLLFGRTRALMGTTVGEYGLVWVVMRDYVSANVGYCGG